MSRMIPLIALVLSLAASVCVAQRPQSDEEKEANRVKIGMSREQQSQIEAMWAETDRQMKEVFSRSNDLRKQLDDLYDSYDFDRNVAGRLRHEIVALHRKRGLIFAENQEKLRRILSRDQFERMTALVKAQREQQRKLWEQRRKEFESRPRDSGHGKPPF